VYKGIDNSHEMCDKTLIGPHQMDQSAKGTYKGKNMICKTKQDLCTRKNIYKVKIQKR